MVSIPPQAAEEPDIPPGMPRELDRNAIASLTQGLDAGDVLECYALVRSAPLHGIADSTIHIQKTAIGFRYRPPGMSQQKKQTIDKHPVEITLEYGPPRVGPMLGHEAIPYVQGSNTNDLFISWENEAKIFYTTEILKESYISSYYMASMTGAVLNKILAQAVGYADHRRYLPFAVYSKKGREIRASSSVDFARYIWRQLANLGVEIHPILPPPIYEARLWVDSVEKVVPSDHVTQEAASFYQKLYQCLEAIATNDYSKYIPPTPPPVPTSPMPSIAMTEEPTQIPTNEQTKAPTKVPTTFPTKIHSKPPTKAPTQLPTKAPTMVPTKEPTIEPTKIATESSPSPSPQPNSDTTTAPSAHLRNRLPASRALETAEVSSNLGSSGLDINPDKDPMVTDHVPPTPSIITQAPSTLYPTTSAPVAATPVSTSLPTTEIVVPEDKVEEAKQAVATAQQAADEAKSAAQTEGDSKAADAAQSAAIAAQVAVDATSTAAAKVAMDSLLSGDGTAMTSIVTQCLTREKYGMGNGTTKSLDAFLYLEGSNYYRLKLTSPYLEMARINQALPQAVAKSEFSGGGELIDFFLAFVVMTALFILVILLLQQVGYEFSRPFYRCQRWFFNPRKYDKEGNTLDKIDDGRFYFREDNIPLSMGGRGSRISPVFPLASTPKTPKILSSARDHSPELSETPRSSTGSTNGIMMELEMTGMSSGGHSIRRSPDHSIVANLSSDDLEENLAVVVPERLFRDPDLVDMPHLKSTSRVAIPVGRSNSPQNSCGTGHPDEVEYTFDLHT